MQARPIPSKLVFSREYDKGGNPVPQETRVVVRDLHELDTGDYKSSPVAHMELVCAVLAKAGWENMFVEQVDVRTAFLQARMTPDDPDALVIPAEGFECTQKQTKQV